MPYASSLVLMLPNFRISTNKSNVGFTNKKPWEIQGFLFIK